MRYTLIGIEYQADVTSVNHSTLATAPSRRFANWFANGAACSTPSPDRACRKESDAGLIGFELQSHRGARIAPSA